MNKPVSDHAVRSEALTPDHSYIVQAPAGSGKTELLIQRYLKLLSLVDSPEEIIAITFTRKAAGEMQNRILAAIELARENKEPEEAHKQQTFALAREVLARNDQFDWQISENPSRLRIQTIDALCAVITRQMPVLSGLGAQPETVDEAEPLYEQAAINTLDLLEDHEPWANALSTLFTHLDNDLPRIKQLLMEMLARRDQWLKHVAGDNQRELLQLALARLIEEKLQAVIPLFAQEIESDLCECINYAAKNLSATNPDHPISACLDLERLPGTTAIYLSQWQGIAALLLTDSENTWRKQANVKIGFPRASGNKAEAEERSSRKKQVQGIIQQLQNTEGLHALLVEIKNLPPPHYTDPEWEVVEALCEVLTLSSAQLHLIFAEKNQMDFSGIAQAAIQALGDSENPTDLALHLDYQVKHLLVDEYQDISVGQYHLLERLTGEWSQGDGRSVFLVGDPQQSIYRFREADVGLFINTFQQRRLGQVALEALTLSVNFRSEQGIIDWINNSFTQTFPAESNTLTGAVAYSPSTAIHANSHTQHVNIYPQFDYSGKQEAEQVIASIQSIKQTAADDSIAVLVRSRTHLRELVPLLKLHNIRFRAVEIEPLIHQAVIQDLLTLTRAILHPADRIAWLALLRAPWCGLELQSLHALFNDKTRTIQESLQQQDLTVQQGNTQTRLQQLISVFNHARENQQRRSLRQTVESLWCQLGGPATLNTDNDLENAQTFFDLLEQLESGSDIEDLQQLLDEAGSLYAASDRHADESLQIMTIHKSKGLEFDHVILPGLGRKTRTRQAALLNWLIRPGQSGDDLILGPIREAGQKKVPIYEYLERVEKEKQGYEEVRLLYVAMTRAKKSIHLSGYASIKENKNTGELSCQPVNASLLNTLWPSVSDIYARAMTKHHQENIEAPPQVLPNQLKRLAPDWQRPEPAQTPQWENSLGRYELDETNEAIEFEWAGETIKHIGSVVHLFIEHLAKQESTPWDESMIKNLRENFKRALAQAGVPTGEKLETATRQVEQALINMINDERGQWILNQDFSEAHNEYPVSGIHAGRLVNIIIDRTFIDAEGTRWIVDYKTSTHTGKDLDEFLDLQQQRYQPQLEKYASLMQSMGDQPIKLGLYFPLLKGWREWTYDHAG